MEESYRYFVRLVYLFLCGSHLCTAQTCGDTTVIYNSPEDVTPYVGDWVHFDCTVLCTYDVRWYIGGYSIPLGLDTHYRPSDLDTNIETVNNSECLSNQDNEHYYTERLSIYITAALDRRSVQCSALSHCNDCSSQVYFSKAATVFLQEDPGTVQESTTVMPPLPSPTPTSAMEGEGVGCTASVTTQTVEITITKTVEIQPTSSPSLDIVPDPTSSSYSYYYYGKLCNIGVLLLLLLVTVLLS